jgi:hypothetical protein
MKHLIQVMEKVGVVFALLRFEARLRPLRSDPDARAPSWPTIFLQHADNGGFGTLGPARDPPERQAGHDISHKTGGHK